jgi:hypothetical protein
MGARSDRSARFQPRAYPEIHPRLFNSAPPRASPAWSPGCSLIGGHNLLLRPVEEVVDQVPMASSP